MFFYNESAKGQIVDQLLALFNSMLANKRNKSKRGRKRKFNEALESDIKYENMDSNPVKVEININANQNKKRKLNNFEFENNQNDNLKIYLKTLKLEDSILYEFLDANDIKSISEILDMSNESISQLINIYENTCKSKYTNLFSFVRNRDKLKNNFEKLILFKQRLSQNKILPNIIHKIIVKDAIWSLQMAEDNKDCVCQKYNISKDAMDIILGL